jgi:hypothetical protein
MRIFALVGILVASACWGQQSPAKVSANSPANRPPHAPENAQQPSQVQQPAMPASANQTITIPAGTRIPLSLTSPLTNKEARPGASVRAVTTFPVAVGAQTAIPVGTYVEGTIDSVNKRNRPGPTLRAHFTRLLYANGYSVPLDATNTQALLNSPELNAAPESDARGPQLAIVPASLLGTVPVFSAFESHFEPQLERAAQRSPNQSTQPPPLHNPGPSMGAVIGIGVGVAVAGIVAILLLNHHGGGGSPVLFDTGWQLDMVLQAPLTVDAASIAVAPGD